MNRARSSQPPPGDDDLRRAGAAAVERPDEVVEPRLTRSDRMGFDLVVRSRVQPSFQAEHGFCLVVPLWGLTRRPSAASVRYVAWDSHRDLQRLYEDWQEGREMVPFPPSLSVLDAAVPVEAVAEVLSAVHDVRFGVPRALTIGVLDGVRCGLHVEFGGAMLRQEWNRAARRFEALDTWILQLLDGLAPHAPCAAAYRDAYSSHLAMAP